MSWWTIRVLTGAAPLKLCDVRREPRSARIGYPRPHGRGPIEAGDRTRTATRCPSSIRVLTGAAPLKRYLLHRIDAVHFPIRVLTGAAPLKRHREAPSPFGGDVYPRPHGRGPIEAMPRLITIGRSVCYPRPHGRGPIEASSSAFAPFLGLGYPRPHGCGPIEARGAGERIGRRTGFLSASSRARPH